MAKPIPVPPPTSEDFERFMKKVRVRADGCWEWAGARFRSGYGMFSFRGKARRAHRVLYVWVNGEHTKDGLDHHCNQRWCVNPMHLEPSSFRKNVLKDGSRAPSAANALKTHCPYGHSEWIVTYRGWRKCRPCENRRAREYQRRRRLIK